MDIKTIIRDVEEEYLKADNHPFWEDGDDQSLGTVFEEILKNDTLIANNTVLFSFVMAGLREAGNKFKRIGKVAISLWKPFLQTVSSKLYEEISRNPEKTIKEIKSKYPSPMPEIIKEAEEKLEQLADLASIRESVTDADGVASIKKMANGYTDSILQLYHEVDADNDTPYVAGAALLESYSDTVSRAFKILVDQIVISGEVKRDHNTTGVVQDIIEYSGYPFCKDAGMSDVLSDLICQLSWRNEVEAYEYISYMLRLTNISVSSFPEAGRELWEPILRYNFEQNKGILANVESDDYMPLANFFPLTKTLMDCRESLSKLDTLSVLNKDTECAAYEAVKALGDLLFDSITVRFNNVSNVNRYMSEKDALRVYGAMVVGSLGYIAAIKSAGAEHNIPSTPKKVSDIKPQPKTVEATPVKAEEDDSEDADPVPVAQKAQKSAPVQEKIAKITPVKKAAEKKQDASQTKQTVDIAPEPTHECTCKNKIDQQSINRLLDESISSLDEYLKLFINQMQNIQSIYYVAKNTKHPEDMSFCVDLLKKLFKKFDEWYDKAAESHPLRGLKPDMEEWDRTRSNIANFKKKANIA